MIRNGIPYSRYVRAGTHLYGIANASYKLGGKGAQILYNAGKYGAKYLKRPTFHNNPSPPGSPTHKRNRPPFKRRRIQVERIASSAGYKPKGFTSKRKRYRKLSKSRRKRGSKTTKGKANFINGMQQRIEATQKVQDLQCVYVGHSTMASITVHKQICIAIAKALVSKEGFAPNSATEPLNINVISELEVLYYPTATSTTPSVDAITIVANPTFQQVADAIDGLLQVIISQYDRRVNYTKFKWFSDNGVGGNYRFYHEFNMNGLMIDGWMRSQINMQNATPSALKSSNIDVNNANPVRVTPYEGKGNGTFWRNRTDTVVGFQNFIGDETAGTISVVASEVANRVLDEPPNPKFFMKARKGSTFVLQPGEIKTSKLYTPVHMSLVKYIQSFEGYSPNTVDTMLNIGKFKLYAVEKVITTNLVGSVPSDVKVQIDYEVDYATCFKATLKKYHAPTAPVNTTLILLDKG